MNPVARGRRDHRLILAFLAESGIMPIISRIVAAVILVSASALVIAFVGSFKFNPDSRGDANFKARAQHKSVPALR